MHVLRRRLAGRLDAMCAIHERAAARLSCLPRPEFERACGARQRFAHLRDLMRLRLLAARCCATAGRASTRDRLLTGWLPLRRAAARFERLVSGSAGRARP